MQSAIAEKHIIEPGIGLILNLVLVKFGFSALSVPRFSGV